MVFLFLNRFSNFLPFAKSKPSEKFLDFLEEQVRNKSPRPDKPESVYGCAPNFLPIDFISAKLLAMTEATAFSPKFLPTMIPHPIA